MNAKNFWLIAGMFVGVIVTAAIGLGALNSNLEIQAIRDAYNAGQIDKETARATMGDKVDEW